MIKVYPELWMMYLFTFVFVKAISRLNGPSPVENTSFGDPIEMISARFCTKVTRKLGNPLMAEKPLKGKIYQLQLWPSLLEQE